MSLTVSLFHRFPGTTLDLSFTAPPGVTALFGRSGSGKTTVVNAVAGLLRPERGRITLEDEVLLDTQSRQELPPHRRRLGYVFQDARLFPHLTVRQNLAYGRWFAPKKQPAADFARVTDLLGIGALLDRRPGALSGGEKARVALGRALLSAPRMLLMDEPLAALDEARKAEILPYLERLRDEFALPILYVSHSPAEVARLATTVILLDRGRVSAAGPVSDVLADPAAAASLGLREAGALISARVEQTEEDGLTRLHTAAGPLWLPAVTAAPGQSLRLRILAQDVTLATTRPENISALNILSGTIRDLTETAGGLLVRLDLGPDLLLARITQRSARALALAPGLKVYALVKSVSLAPESIGAEKPGNKKEG